MARPAVRHLAAGACAVVWIAAAVATHIPPAHLSDVHVRDIVLHTVGYFVLASVFLITLRLHGWGWLRRASCALPILLVYGALDELTQPWFHRCAALADFWANTAGILAAIVFDAILTALQRRFA